MLYRKLTIWNGTDGHIWHALSAENGRDLSMGTLKTFEIDKIINFAKSHSMKIEDQRQ